MGPGNDACPALWSVVVAHERRRQDDSQQLGMTQNLRTATDEQVWQIGLCGCTRTDSRVQVRVAISRVRVGYGYCSMGTGIP